MYFGGGHNVENLLVTDAEHIDGCSRGIAKPGGNIGVFKTVHDRGHIPQKNLATSIAGQNDDIFEI